MQKAVVKLVCWAWYQKVQALIRAIIQPIDPPAGQQVAMVVKAPGFHQIGRASLNHFVMLRVVQEPAGKVVQCHPGDPASLGRPVKRTVREWMASQNLHSNPFPF